MMVTFVSECEKKALNKTRRVLDAFANRIGKRTWQTVITEEGLQAVKKLLRQSATKNTAVSCHWIRSRSRSEFLWLVGSSDKFNAEGIVPVNYTNTIQLIMDDIKVKTDKIYANTKQQPLDQHLFAVGYIAYQIIQQFVDDDKLAKAVFVAGCLHDLGKIDPEFQQWVYQVIKKTKGEAVPEEGQHIDKGKFSFETHPRHNEISLLLYHLMSDDADKTINKRNKDRIKHVLYWHHAKPIRKTEFKKLDSVYKKLKKNIGSAEFATLIQTIRQITKAIDSISEEYFSQVPLKISAGLQKKVDEDREYELAETSLPSYKRYSLANDDIDDYLGDIKDNAKNNLARTAVITADRLISSINSEQLLTHIKDKTLDALIEEQVSLKQSDLTEKIQQCLLGFEKKYPNSDRNHQQAKAAQRLAEVTSVGVLNGPAGCGKTKIALEWAANTNTKKIVWVCPRVQVCQGLINDLTSNEYLPDAKIEINTGEFKFIYQSGDKTETPEGKEFSGDVVMTTIDQITNAIITHRSVTSLVDYMNAHVVFDEYHEYINMSSFNLLFAELVQCKKFQQQAKALLVSATPNYYFTEEFLGIDRDDIIGIDSFNESQYKIQFTPFDEAKQDETNPLYQAQPDNTIIISNTAQTAQKSFIANQDNENALIFHSKYKKKDKDELFNKIVSTFEKGGTKEYAILRSGPVVQASLNITCDQMVTEFTHAENWLQRLGRLDRFGENDKENKYITAIPETLVNGKQSGACARFLNSLNSLQSAKAWYEFVQDKLPEEPVSIAQIYQLYQEFYDKDTHRKAVEEDLKTALKKSIQMIDLKLIDPVSLPRKKKTKDEKVKIKKHSLRGDNRFVQMAICNINSQANIEFPNQYAYSETDLEANLTAPVEVICGYGDSQQDLLGFMVKKHHNIKAVKKSYKDSFTLNEARNPETPIYLSYTPEDLKLVEAKPHPYAIYYAIGKKQPIGAISINKIVEE